MKGMERSFTDREYERKGRRELFPEQTMDGLIPWDCLVEGVSPYSPQAGKGRVHYPLSVGVDTAAALRPTLLQFERITGEPDQPGG